MHALAFICLAVFALVNLSACGNDEQVELPPPVPLTQEAIGYYCNMTVVEHQGPKGQIQLKGQSKPIWFSSARDTIAFTMLPEESKEIAVIYVTDMTDDGAWNNPEKGKWVDATTAQYVVGSSRVGGMGAPEPVPFSTVEAAELFANQYGGKVMAFSDIPEDSILGMVEIGDGHDTMNHGDGDDHGNMDRGNTQMNMEQGG